VGTTNIRSGNHDQDPDASGSKPKKYRKLKKSRTDRLSGTTLRIYRLMYKSGHPMGVNEIQRLAGLSSPSVAFYHLTKLKDLGLVKETSNGYLVDKVLLRT